MGQGGKGGREGEKPAGGNSKSHTHLPIKGATDKNATLYAAISKPTTWCRGVEEVAWGGGKWEVGRGAKRSEGGHDRGSDSHAHEGSDKESGQTVWSHHQAHHVVRCLILPLMPVKPSPGYTYPWTKQILKSTLYNNTPSLEYTLYLLFLSMHRRSYIQQPNTCTQFGTTESWCTYIRWSVYRLHSCSKADCRAGDNRDLVYIHQCTACTLAPRLIAGQGRANTSSSREWTSSDCNQGTTVSLGYILKKQQQNILPWSLPEEAPRWVQQGEVGGLSEATAAEAGQDEEAFGL